MKYTQPKPNPDFTDGQGYPIDDIDLTGTKSFNRYVEPYGKKKKIIDMRGYGAAERGRKFHVDDNDRNPVKTNRRIPVDTKG